MTAIKQLERTGRMTPEIEQAVAAVQKSFSALDRKVLEKKVAKLRTQLAKAEADLAGYGQ
jgi:DNA-binding FrmR family transcriptional regulator